MKRVIWTLCLMLFSQTMAQDNPSPVPMKQYLEFARKSADWTWEHRDSLETAWRRTMDHKSIFGYRPPSRFLEMATIYATLYELEMNQAYAERAKNILMVYDDYRKEYSKEAAKRRPDYEGGVPPLPDFFTTMRYIRPYEILKRLKYLGAREIKKMEAVITQSITYTLQTQEWGAMNRAMLRAETLAWALRALPGAEDSKLWRMYEYALGFDNWGNWEIEDATIYHAVWLYSLLGYADAKNEMGELFHTPEMFYYAQYFLNLMCPDGMIPDFGDANWHSNWTRYLVFFEAAAAGYDDPELKWAAATITNRFIDFKNIQNTGLAYLLLDCFRYGSDLIEPKVPTSLSKEVMEDVQGKKIVFRNGWDSQSTYMLLNYRDEGDGGLIFRDYLRDAIPVEEEKMTHGHADENSIALLMSGGSVLLHDGGYRDYMPSGPYGAYRQDYFHNRLCVRQEKIWMGQKKGEYRYSPTDHPAIPGQSVMDFLHNAGSYRRIRTQKIDFLTFPDFDYSRTRLIDDKLGYEWDRVIVYVKDPELFVVFDILKATVEEFFTAANLWHTRHIVAQGDHWYDTAYDSLRSLPLSADNHLLIYFPKTHYRLEQMEKESRYYQKEWVISQTTAQHFELGQHIGFATVLVPHSKDTDPTQWLDKIRYDETEPYGAGMGIEITSGASILYLGVKCDLRMDMIRDWRRPKYTYESGRIRYGQLETNGDFLFTKNQDNIFAFTIVNLTRAVYNRQILFDQAPGFFGLTFDGSSDEKGVGKARYWRDEIRLR
jgi:hypothetical protein